VITGGSFVPRTVMVQLCVAEPPFHHFIVSLTPHSVNFISSHFISHSLA
jgi:hypothetical protein